MSEFLAFVSAIGLSLATTIAIAIVVQGIGRLHRARAMALPTSWPWLQFSMASYGLPGLAVVANDPQKYSDFVAALLWVDWQGDGSGNAP